MLGETYWIMHQWALENAYRYNFQPYLFVHLEMCNSLYSDGLIKYVWLMENTRKEEAINKAMRQKRKFMVLILSNKINNFLKNKQNRQ